MAKVIKQYRYYNDEALKNQPSNLSQKELTEGSVFFTDNLRSIIQLGIQTLPGTQFYINNSDKNYPIIVGSTGIYELDLDGFSAINTLSFNDDSLRIIANTNNAFLIIDALYEVEEE